MLVIVIIVTVVACIALKACGQSSPQKVTRQVTVRWDGTRVTRITGPAGSRTIVRSAGGRRRM